ncbi:cytochrome P450 2J4-like [Aplochiton taeniatus]
MAGFLVFVLDWMDVRSFLFFFFIFLLVADYWICRPPANFPPGPRALPFVGNVFGLDAKLPQKSLLKVAQTHGNVYNMRFGRDRVVVVVGFKMVKAGLITQGDDFVDRPPSPLQTRIYDGKGFFFSSGYLWKKQRRFALSTLRNLGLGKRSLEAAILEECKFFQDEVDQERGKPFDPELLLNKMVANIICTMVFGQRFEYSSPRFQKMLKLLKETFSLLSSVWIMIYELVPSIMRVLPGPHNKVFQNYEELCSYFQEEIQKHKLTRDPSEPRDYIDYYLEQTEKASKLRDLLDILDGSSDPGAGFDDANMVLCIMDLLLAGTETTYTSLRWALLYMIKYPHIQKKVQEEIDQVVGPGRQPAMVDRAHMPYTDAVLHETQRIGDIIPVGIPHMAIRDTTLAGYSIPKGTAVLFVLSSVLSDKKEWKTPDSFDPENFLDSEGNFVRKEAFLPFAAGKRMCIGEPLARMELFIFFTAFLQRYNITSPDGVEPRLGTEGGSTNAPFPFKICAQGQ